MVLVVVPKNSRYKSFISKYSLCNNLGACLVTYHRIHRYAAPNETCKKNHNVCLVNIMSFETTQLPVLRSNRIPWFGTTWAFYSSTPSKDRDFSFIFTASSMRSYIYKQTYEQYFNWHISQILQSQSISHPSWSSHGQPWRHKMFSHHWRIPQTAAQ